MFVRIARVDSPVIGGHRWIRIEPAKMGHLWPVLLQKQKKTIKSLHTQNDEYNTLRNVYVHDIHAHNYSNDADFMLYYYCTFKDRYTSLFWQHG